MLKVIGLDKRGYLQMCNKKKKPSSGGKKAVRADETGLRKWTTHVSEYRELLIRMSCTAEKNDCVLNKDNERVDKVLGLMAENVVVAGRAFCPCKQSKPLNVSKDVVCPCPEWQKEIEKDGHCFCKLFFRKPADKRIQLGIRMRTNL